MLGKPTSLLPFGAQSRAASLSNCCISVDLQRAKNRYAEGRRIYMRIRFNRNDTRRQAVLARMNHLAWLLDNSINIPIVNYRIGLDAVIGLVPGIGDIAGLVLSSYIIVQAVRLGVPGATILRMMANVGIETLLGTVPLLGDVFDATYKANVRNVRLLLDATGRA
jgi:hypothetical protein